jgi:hypothetical protein
MFCHECGKENPDNATTCSSCGASFSNPYKSPTGPGGSGALPPISNYLVQSILVTLCCCLPCGIVAIVYAAQVNGLLAGGNVAGAQKAANSAKMWCLIGFGVGLVVGIIYLGIGIIGGLADQKAP